ncbi:ABC transporter transmembrane domain-containing protein [Henriciella sp.]|uniref:ABC transporter transmembrane domain-containing protein n=1 Tax=Henriciella sp. TaxID=1968823 RepID=UPI0026216F77|nr:ABC transporter transmembrane domain-containing protein [Henriciella sp.]
MAKPHARPGRHPMRESLAVFRAVAVRRDMLVLVAALACVVLASLLAGLAPVALKLLVDTLAGEEQGAVVGGIHLPALGLLCIYVGTLGVVRLAGEGRTFLFGTADQSISRRLSRKVLDHILALPMSYHLRQTTGATLQILENGLQGYRLLLQHSLFTLLPGLIEITVIAIVLAGFFDAVFLGIFATCAVAYGLVFTHGARRVLAASRSVSGARIEANAGLADTLLNVETVKAYTGEATITARHDRRLADVQHAWRGFYQARVLNGMLVALIFAAGLGLTLWLALARVKAGAMTVGDFVLVNAYMIQLVQPLERLGFGIRDIGQGVAYVERLIGLLGEAPERRGLVHEGGTAQTLDEAVSVRFDAVSFSYDGTRKVLDGVSFEAAPGTMTALVGPSGGGKSSVLRLLLRFHEPDRGEILLNGAPLASYPLEVLRGMIAVIPQDTILFNDTLAFNIGFPAGPGIGAGAMEDIDWAARMAELDTLAARLPDGYGTRVGERGLHLSGGEKQRVAIARALLRRPGLLLADEATSALDTQTEAGIAARLADAARGVTSIVVAHRLSTIAGADRILVLEGGRIVEDGTHEGLMAAGGLYAQMWRGQGG